MTPKFDLTFHPLQRLFISLGFGLLMFLTIRHRGLSELMVSILCWIAFALSYTLLTLRILFRRSVSEIRKTAMDDDGGSALVLLLVLLSSLASVITLFVLIISKEQHPYDKVFFSVTAILGMLISWVMIHTVFTFHYAHLYYNKDRKTAHGLDFPGEEEPDYLDFAYFAFVIGCTFQVSDVVIRSKTMRRLVLLHGLLSFGLNTFVVALMVNLVAGISH